MKNYYVSVYASDEFTGEEVKAFLWERESSDKEALLKLKQVVDLLKGDFDGFEGLTVDNFLCGDFISDINSKLEDEINDNEYIETKDSMEDYKNEKMNIRYHSVIVSSYGFSIKAFENYTNIKWQTNEIPWSILEVI